MSIGTSYCVDEGDEPERWVYVECLECGKGVEVEESKCDDPTYCDRCAW